MCILLQVELRNVISLVKNLNVLSVNPKFYKQIVQRDFDSRTFLNLKFFNKKIIE